MEPVDFDVLRLSGETHAAFSPALAKMTMPVPGEIVERPRLYRLLDAARGRAVTWVTGPAGCGKTTLVASYLQQARVAAAPWYSVDPGDADPASLFYFLRLAIANAAVGAPSAPPAALEPEHLSGLPAFARRFFREAFAALPSPFTLVFDNLQDVPETAPFLDLLSEGLRELPAGDRLILVSRQEPAPAFVRYRAARQLAQIDWSDLRFEAEEAENLLKLLSWGRGECNAVSAIMAAASGWAAALVLLTEQPARGVERGVTFDQACTDYVFDYFAAEVWRNVEADQRDFLMKTSLLPIVTPRMAESLTGNPRSAAALASLARRNFFTMRRAGSDTYEYHPLFRGFLQREAQTAYSVERLAEMRCAAIDILVEAGHLNEAVTLIRECGDWPRLVRLVGEEAPRLLAQAHHRTLEAWLAPVPVCVLEESPRLLYWLGAARAPLDPATAEGLLARVFRRLRDEGDAAGAYLAWATIAEIVGHSLQYTKQADRLIDELESLRAVHPECPSEELECRIAAGMLMVLAFHRPLSAELGKWRERGEALADRTANVDLEGRLLLALYHSLMLAPLDSKRSVLLDRISALCDRPDVPDTLRVLAQAASVNEHCHAGRHADCRAAAREALALAERCGIFAYDLLVHARLARSALNRGDLPEARQAIEKMGPLVHARGGGRRRLRLLSLSACL